MKNSNHLTLFLLFIIKIPLFGNEVLPTHIELFKEFEKIEMYATQNNPLYLREKTNINMTRGDIITASLYYNPILGIQQQFIGASRNSGPGLPELYTRYEQPLDVSGVIPQRKKVAYLDFQISLSQFADFDRIFRLRLRQNFLAYVYLTQMIQIQYKFYENYNDLLDLTKYRAEKGDISYLEYDRISLERIEIERTLKELEYRRNQIEKQLIILVGDSNLSNIISTTPSLEFYPLKELGIQLEKDNITKRPDYQALLKLEERERMNIELKKKEAVPPLNLGGEVVRKGDETFTGIFASIPLPIYNRNQGEILKAKEKEKFAKFNLMYKLNEIKTEISILKKELLERENQLINYKNIGLIEKNKEVQEKTRYGYIRGAFNLVNLIEAERNYLSVLRNYNELVFLYYNTIEEFKSATYQLNQGNMDYE